jgi:branched-chain amino acid aminotransferase
MKIAVTKVSPENLKKKPPKGAALGFGKMFSDHMFLIDYDKGKGWHDARIEPYHAFSLDPATIVLHYGQGIFEGLKAYRWQNGEIWLFRPKENYERLNFSARRLCMPEISTDDALEATRELVRVEKDWVPSEPGSSLYIRPTMIATEVAVGVHVAAKYLFYIIVGPVGAYYPQGFSPTDIYITEKYTRAAMGGLGEAKTMANYAASLLAQEEAHQLGYTQVLWLDPVERKYVEEVGTSNIFFYLGDELVTPALTGTILAGITRGSVIRMARDWGMKVSERRISLDEVLAALERGTLKEAFATGTAATISPVGKLAYRGKTYSVNDGKVGPLAQRLYDTIMGIQYGRVKDPYGWVEKVVK